MKFKVGDIGYTISVSEESLYVYVNKCIVTYVNSNDSIGYVCLGNHEIIKDFSTKEEQEKKGSTISGTSRVNSFFLESELDEAIKKAVDSTLEQIRIKDMFRCPLTGEKFVDTHKYLHVYDGPNEYLTEISGLKWETYPRDYKHGVYHHGGRSFEYIGHGDWRELVLIEDEDIRRGKYFDKEKYESGDEDVLREIDSIKEEWRLEKLRREEEKKNRKNNLDGINFPTFKPVYSKLVKSELVEVKPMSAPSIDLLYVDYGNESSLEVKVRIKGIGDYKIRKNDYEQIKSGTEEGFITLIIE